jgi:hypothetical protein
LVSGPSKFGMGRTRFSHVLDGFGRFSHFKIENGKISLTSKMMDTVWKKKAEESNEVIPGLTFRETNPPRWMSSLPFINLIYSN